MSEEEANQMAQHELVAKLEHTERLLAEANAQIAELHVLVRWYREKFLGARP